MATVPLERAGLGARSEEEHELARQYYRESQLRDAAEKLKEKGIARVAILKSDSGDEKSLARHLGILTVESHDSVEALLGASIELDVVVALPTHGKQGEIGNNRRLWLQAGYPPSIAHVQDPTTKVFTDLIVSPEHFI